MEFSSPTPNRHTHTDTEWWWRCDWLADYVLMQYVVQQQQQQQSSLADFTSCWLVKQ